MARENKKFIGQYVDENNNPLNEPGFIAWHSRSIAVVGIITNKQHDKFLLERRGENCPDFVGKLCCPCGYLNWDERIKEAIIREIYEETNISIDINDPKTKLIIIGINDEPNEGRQNVTFRFLIELENFDDIVKSSNFDFNDTLLRGGEDKEVSEILVLSNDDIVTLDKDDFAFNHKELLLSEIFVKKYNFNY